MRSPLTEETGTPPTDGIGIALGRRRQGRPDITGRAVEDDGAGLSRLAELTDAEVHDNARSPSRFMMASLLFS
jgi:hypothetical protein